MPGWWILSSITPAVVGLGQAVHRHIRLIVIYIMELKPSTVTLSFRKYLWNRALKPWKSNSSQDCLQQVLKRQQVQPQWRWKKQRAIQAWIRVWKREITSLKLHSICFFFWLTFYNQFIWPFYFPNPYLFRLERWISHNLFCLNFVKHIDHWLKVQHKYSIITINPVNWTTRSSHTSVNHF